MCLVNVAQLVAIRDIIVGTEVRTLDSLTSPDLKFMSLIPRILDK
jgi:hypothetical protein